MSIFVDECSWRQKMHKRRSRRRLAFLPPSRLLQERQCARKATRRRRASMLIWVKFVWPCFFHRPCVVATFLCCGPAKRASTAPAPSPHSLFFSHTLLFRRGLGVLTTWAVDPKFVITFKVDVLTRWSGLLSWARSLVLRCAPQKARS